MTGQREEQVGVVDEDLSAAIAFVRTPDGHSRLELAKFHTPTAVSAEPGAPANTPGIRHILSSTRTAVGSESLPTAAPVTADAAPEPPWEALAARVGVVTESFRAEGVRVLITGGTSGLGAAMASALLDAGAAVAITGRDDDRAAAAARELGTACRGIGMDVRDDAAVKRGVDRVVDEFGGLDVLVNNAGIGMRTVNPRFLTDPQPFWVVPAEGFRDVVATNLTGYFLVARDVVPRFLAAGSGRVVTISMNHSTMNRKGFVPYGPARSGAEALARIMAADLTGSGVTANILLPGGATASGMVPDDYPPERRAQLLDPQIMGPPIRWLCSPQAAAVHDERIVATQFDKWLSARTA